MLSHNRFLGKLQYDTAKGTFLEMILRMVLPAKTAQLKSRRNNTLDMNSVVPETKNQNDSLYLVLLNFQTK